MPLDAETVRAVAALARLSLTGEEAARFARDLAAILDHFADLQTVDVEGVPPTSHAVPIACPLRPDAPERGVDPADILAGAPAREGAFFSVPRGAGGTG